MQRQKIQERADFDTYDRDIIWEKTGGRCAHCGKEIYVGYTMTVDHFIPLNQGGINSNINLIPLCKECNKEKNDLVLHPRDFLRFLKERHMKDIEGYYDSYIHSFDYISRNNILANDEYDITIPMVPESGVVNNRHGRNRYKRKDTHTPFAYLSDGWKGRQAKLKRAHIKDADRLLDFYIKYLKKYNLLDSESAAKSNLYYWYVKGCIYYVEQADGTIKCMLTCELIEKEDGDVYFRVLPFFLYSNNFSNLALFDEVVIGTCYTVISEIGLHYLPVLLVVASNDKITRYSRFQSCYDSSGTFFDYYYIRFLEDKIKQDSSYTTKVLDSLCDVGGEWYYQFKTIADKVKSTSAELEKLINYPIYSPFVTEGEIIDEASEDSGEAAV